MAYLYGLVGFFGYEGLKYYKRSWEKKELIAKSHYRAYFFSLVAVGILSAVIAHLLADGKNLLAIYIGFSLPTNAEKILGPKGSDREIHVDDINLADDLSLTTRSLLSKLKNIFSIYF